jgi:hypothetical protein
LNGEARAVGAVSQRELIQISRRSVAATIAEQSCAVATGPHRKSRLRSFPTSPLMLSVQGRAPLTTIFPLESSAAEQASP